jgi:serine phosphatase RsbU (regulator of sigma subunit)
MRAFCLLISIFSLNYIFSQNKLIDSLKNKLAGQGEDTAKINTLNILSRQLDNNGDQKAALNYSDTALFLSQKLQFKKGLAASLKTHGNIYFNQSNFPRALEYYLKALKTFDYLGDKQGIGKCLGSIGNVYQYQSDYTKSLEYYLLALTKFEETDNKQAIGKTFNNIGEVYRHLVNYQKALEYYLKGLKVFNEIEDKQGAGNCYNNIGIVFKNQSNFSKALEYYLMALKIREGIKDKQGMGTSYNNLGELFSAMSEFNLAIHYCDSALKINKEIGDIDLLRTSYENIAGVYAKKGNFKLAYFNYVQFKHLTDTIFSTSNSKKLGDLKTNFEVEKKEAELKLKAEVQQAISDTEKKQQQLITYIVASALILVLLFTIFVFNRYKVTKRQKYIIEKQKESVEENQKQIIDSIKYAKRIQSALLTSEKYISNYLKDFFIIFKPKDIVSGDFYYAIYIRNKFYLATADCTGHGVPGALMSMLGISFLNEIIIKKSTNDPDKILNQLREEIVAALNQKGSNEESSDGMDISLCCFDFSTNTLAYACANRGIYILRNKELIELKPDKMPVGKHLLEANSFTLHEIQLQPDDIVYTYTDGYPDQFGGPKGKKYNYKKFEEDLKSNDLTSLKEQKELFLKNFDAWKGNLEQVDDMTLIGIRI